MAEYDIGVCLFLVNEAKFLPYSVESFVNSSAVKKVVLVEGHVKGYPKKNVSKKGLSTDGSSKIAADLVKSSSKVEYIPMGWVDDKRNLQNEGFRRIRESLGEGAIYMLAGADEVYHPHELVALQQQFRENPRAKIVVYPFYHFWWRPDLVATGSSWSVLMHRAYRRPGLPMKFAHHAAPPADCGRGPKVHAKEGNRYVVACYHYVGMQDAEHILAKLELYKKRDGHRLNVTDTWSDWQWGDRTQWTHDGGSVKRFDGTHPAVIEKDVWSLTPRGLGGGLLPLPEVPWDKDGKAHVVMPPKNLGVFIEGRRIPDDPYVLGLLSDLVEHHEVTIYTLDGELEEAGKYKVRKFSSRAVNSHALVIVFVESFVWRPMGAPHVAIVWKKLDFEIDFSGYAVYQTPDVPSRYSVLPSTEKFLAQALESAERKVRTPKRKPRRAKVLPEDSGIVTPIPRGSVVDTMQVQIVNVTPEAWKRGSHYVGCFWADNRGHPYPGAPRTKGDLPREIKAGETLTCAVAVPRPPRDMENGFLKLCIDILDQGKSQWLGVGCQTPVRIRNWRIFR